MIKIWAGKPSYQGTYKEFPAGNHKFSLRKLFDRYEGKFVVQLFNNDKLLDERVVNLKPGTARLISKVHRTKPAMNPPKDMVKIPGASILDTLSQHASFVPYPPEPKKSVHIKTFYIDKYPVTNAQYYAFIKATHYKPVNTSNYLKNWVNDHYPKGEGKKPVVWIDLKDARAYAKWAGKRLPTEMEWQLAAHRKRIAKNDQTAAFAVRAGWLGVAESVRPDVVDGFPLWIEGPAEGRVKPHFPVGVRINAADPHRDLAHSECENDRAKDQRGQLNDAAHRGAGQTSITSASFFLRIELIFSI